MCLTYLTEEQRIERVALYIMALDALNFCFWPIPGLNYEHLAMALKSIAEQDEKLLPILSSSYSKDWNDQHYGLSPYKLRCITVDGMNRLLQESQLLPICNSLPGQVLPNLHERCRLWNELGEGLLCRFQGKAMALLQACQKSADYLVYLVVQTFPGFHDTAIDDCGRQVSFYKRAQILVGDIWASLRTRCTYCDFEDIHKLTMFPDYRVPQLLRHMQILTYSPELARQIDSEEVIMAGSMDELYIRAATVVAVEQQSSYGRLPQEQGINCSVEWQCRRRGFFPGVLVCYEARLAFVANGRSIRKSRSSISSPSCKDNILLIK
jgi:hypothetical protein